MVDATPFLPGLSLVQGKAVVARFDGGRLSSEGGLLALREIAHTETRSTASFSSRACDWRQAKQHDPLMMPPLPLSSAEYEAIER